MPFDTMGAYESNAAARALRKKRSNKTTSALSNPVHGDSESDRDYSFSTTASNSRKGIHYTPTKNPRNLGFNELITPTCSLASRTPFARLVG